MIVKLVFRVTTTELTFSNISIYYKRRLFKIASKMVYEATHIYKYILEVASIFSNI